MSGGGRVPDPAAYQGEYAGGDPMDGVALEERTPCEHDWVEDERESDELVETVNYHCSKCPMVRVSSGTPSSLSAVGVTAWRRALVAHHVQMVEKIRRETELMFYGTEAPIGFEETPEEVLFTRANDHNDPINMLERVELDALGGLVWLDEAASFDWGDLGGYEESSGEMGAPVRGRSGRGLNLEEFLHMKETNEGEPMFHTTTVLLAAAIMAHEANRIYCQLLGDDSQVPWDDAPDWQKDSAKEGVHAISLEPDLHPSESHVGWMKQKVEDGWVYGEEKDAEAKTHPCMVPYDELPEEQRLKDTIFGAVVRAVLFGVSGREAMDRSAPSDPGIGQPGDTSHPATLTEDDIEKALADASPRGQWDPNAVDPDTFRRPAGATFDGEGVTVIYDDGATARWRSGHGWNVGNPIPGTLAEKEVEAKAAKLEALKEETEG